MSLRAAALLVTFMLLLPATASGDERALTFARDIRPILAAKCFACHGPDEAGREAELRLDLRKAAVQAGAIVPGQPARSELIRRISAADVDQRMPPADSGQALTQREQDALSRWIAAGAHYQRHWSFVTPSRPSLPRVSAAGWPRNEIDYFVLARLEKQAMRPSPEADRYTLIRRVYLDLIGLLPTPAEADAFAADPDPQAYQNLVDRLLASPHYGEHWARQWLDLARYADTNGYEKDRPRSIWPYRDWVIRAINADLPFDRFSIEQLAGDLLPDANDDQRIATGFHRNTMLNEEGGIDPLEFRFYAMVDRVATTGTVWLGLTTGCAQCHAHKYDPISHTDYYRLMALLNNADEPDLIVRDMDVAEQRRRLQHRIDQLERELPAQFAAVTDQPAARFADWLAGQTKQAVDWTVLEPVAMHTNLPRLERLADGSILSTGDITKRDVYTLKFDLDAVTGPITALRLEVLPDDRLPARGPGRCYYEGRKGDFFLSEFTARAAGRAVSFASASHSYGRISIGSGNADAENVFDGDGSTGWSTSGGEGKAHQLVLNLAQPLAARGRCEIQLVFERHFAASLGRFRLSAAASGTPVRARQLPVHLEAMLARGGELTAAEVGQLKRYFYSLAPELEAARQRIAALRKQLPEFPTTLVLHERSADNPRPTFRHHRGEYLSRRERVEPALPAFLPPLATGVQPDRLGLARWLVSERNPLAGRVTVNRAWQAFFGHGLVRTPADLGTQGELPTHPGLLDWLAVEFSGPVQHGGLGWSRKRLHRLIVSSATYRQSSRLTPQRLAHDPENRLLARGPRWRVDAETLRDQLLVAGGLLTRRLGGPSVFPPQPESVTELAFGNFKWQASPGADRHRRSLYTFRKRTAPFAAYLVFDGSTGENCTVRRNRSNTPLQSLTLLNDAMFLEVARALARRAVCRAETPEARATLIWRRLLTRPPSPGELEPILDFQRHQSVRLETGELDADEVWGDPRGSVELATWFLVARALINLDEAITKP